MSAFRLTPRIFIAVAAGIFILAFLNWNIVQKERLIEHGRVVLLQLAPVDPRSLMQGDYMALRFALERETRGKINQNQMIILAVGENDVAQFSRIDDGQSALQPGEVRFRYYLPNAFFFEEGQGKAYAPARYGEFRVAEDGSAILTQLRDEAFHVLQRGAARN
jgi:uncharacterized membrane-anchored protein